METRDQWYKPNLLYNIHYRPPKKPEQPKMIVETVQFNPSVCTCGEHGCQPQYRMEKRVLWMNKEVCNANHQSKVNDREKKNEYRESKFEERITEQDRRIGNVIERDQMELKERNDQEFRLVAEGDGNKCCSAESFEERISSDIEVRSGYKAKYSVKEKENVAVEGADKNDDEEEEEVKEESDRKYEVGYCDSKDDICINEEASDTKIIKQNNNNDRSDRDSSEGGKSERVCGKKSKGNDPETVYNNHCKWGENNSNESHIDKGQTTRKGDRVVDRDGAGDDDENFSETRAFINNSDKTAEFCSLESKDEDVEIASAFGIISIYCNSELHSWTCFKGEDASKKIH